MMENRRPKEPRDMTTPVRRLHRAVHGVLRTWCPYPDGPTREELEELAKAALTWLNAIDEGDRR